MATLPDDRYRRADHCLVFLHLPKTAGTTLASSLAWNFPVGSTLHVNLYGKPVADLGRIPLDQRSRLRLLHGHVPYGVHDYIPRPCSYITIVREPVSRVVSAYKYVLQTPHHRHHREVVQGGVGLEEFIQTYWTEERRDRQTRQLCDRPSGPIDDHAVAQAQDNLSKFLVVGLTDRFVETFVLLRRALRMRVPFYVTRNVTVPLEPSDKALQLIASLESNDQKLYGFAEKLFADRVAAQKSSFEGEVAIFNAIRPLSRVAGSGGRAERLLRSLTHARTARG
jgi:hypothetical protein